MALASLLSPCSLSFAQQDLDDLRSLPRPRTGKSALHSGKPSVRIVSARVRDNGDGDHWADTNETVELDIVVFNGTGVDLFDVTARLETDDDKVACVAQDVSTLSSFGEGQTSVISGFRFAIGDVSRTSLSQDLSIAMRLFLFSGSEELPVTGNLVLDLDLDAQGGSGATAYFEGFEDGLGGFTPQPLDDPLNPPPGDLGNKEAGVLNADRHRCQYHDPDWEGSVTAGTLAAESCFPNANSAPDTFWWQIQDERAFSGSSALYFGLYLDADQGHTTPLGQLEAVRTASPVNLGWDRVCSVSRSVSCQDAGASCPDGEECVDVHPTLSFKHQVSLVDHRVGIGSDGQGVDRGIVQAQRVDATGAPIGPWIKLHPYLNVYDTQPNMQFYNCTFDPIDDGNTEDYFFDPEDPTRLLGPSSTCFPELNFTDQGSTEGPFDASNTGGASDGPGLEGSSGQGTWVEPVFSLDRFRGHRLRLRFLETGLKGGGARTWEEFFGWNPEPGDDGWFIDDVLVTDTLVGAASMSVDAKDNDLLKEDWDLDGVAATCDCAPDDETAWSAPGEVTTLVLAHAEGTTSITWSAPTTGGTSFEYDTLRSTLPSDFGDALCIESNTMDTTAIDATTPEPSAVHYFLVRAESSCGAGPIGEGSSGVARIAADCP